MVSLRSWSIDGLDMGAQLPKVVKVNQLPHIHPLASEACTRQLATMQGKDVSFTWMLVYWGYLYKTVDNLAVQTRQIFFQIHFSSFQNVTEGKRVTTGVPFWNHQSLEIRAAQVVLFGEVVSFCHITSLRPSCKHSTDQCKVTAWSLTYSVYSIPLRFISFLISLMTVCLPMCAQYAFWERFIWLSKMIHIHCTTCQLFRQW